MSDAKRVLSMLFTSPRLKLSQQCIDCKWNKPSMNEDKKCNYVYCTKEEWFR